MDSPIQSAASPINPHELVRLLTDLQVGIRKYSMYSGAHATIPQMVATLTAQYRAVLGAHESLQIGVTKDEILYQGTPVATGNPVVRELARLLNQINVAGVTFRKDLVESDLRDFLRVLAECRAWTSSAERDLSIEGFDKKDAAISFQFITFRGAVKDRDAATAGSTEEATQLWRGLVNRLMAEVTDSSQAALAADEEEGFDAERLAAAINQLAIQRKPGDDSYERSIVSYLHEKAAAAASGEQRAQMNQQLHRLFSNLTPEVRQRLFRIAIEPVEGSDTTPAEAFFDALPTPMLVELLDQIQVSNHNVSLPTFSLLRKFSILSDSDPSLATRLETKLGDQRDLLQELLTKRADRTFYPEQYRALLDEEFSEHTLGKATASPSAASEFDDAQVDSHLASILLEMLEAPVRSQDQYSQTVLSLKEMVARGIGDQTSSIFSEAITILGKQYASAGDDRREFFRECVTSLFQADSAHHLFDAGEATQDSRQREALAQLLEIVGPSIIPLLLDKLETEQNLKARKRLLALLRDCGDAVVPLAIERLRHAQWYVVRNVLLLLRDLVAVQAVPEVARCIQHQSAQVRLAAFQTLGSLAPRGDLFLQALKRALDDPDPKVFRAALTHLVSSPDQASLQLAGKLLLEDSSAKHRERQLAVLRLMEQAGTSAVLPVLHALMRHHLFRFWSWRKTRTLRSAAARALAAIRKREDEHTTGHARRTSHDGSRDGPAAVDPDATPQTPTEDSPTETAHVGPQEPV